LICRKSKREKGASISNRGRIIFKRARAAFKILIIGDGAKRKELEELA
jgi:hypothetical protein